MPHKTQRRAYWKSMVLAALMTSAFAPLNAQTAADAKPAPVPDGFTAIFDGRTLAGWKGDKTFWSVRDGAITGGAEKQIDYNTYLILEQSYPNFEIRFKYRFLTEAGNSGLQFRSGQAPGNHVLAGMQSNVTPVGRSLDRFAMLYDELGDRQEMVLLGQKAQIDRIQQSGGGTGRIVRTVTGTVNPQADIIKSVKPAGQWNEDVLIVYGNRFVHAVNGYLAFDATDADPLSPKDGLIGFQLHKGVASYVQFKDIVIRPLSSFPDIAGRFISKPGPAPTPNRTYKDSTKVNTPDTPLDIPFPE